MKTKFVSLLAASLIYSSCAKSPSPATDARETNRSIISNQKYSSNIVNGQQLSADNPGRSSAIALLRGDGSFICSGTLIAENLIVTAAHCLHGGIQDIVTDIGFGDSMNRGRIIKREVIESDVFAENDVLFPNDDLAWLKFEGDVPAGYKPIKILADIGRLEEKNPLTLVGFGQTSDDPDSSAGDRLTGETVFERFLDSPEWNNLIVVGPSPGTGSCSGDSGGPAYVKIDGEWFLLGASNGTDDRLTPDLSCASGHSIYTYVGAYMEWITKTSGVTLP